MDSSSEDKLNKDLSDIVNELVDDYSKYHRIDTSSEIKSFEDAIETILGHFEEFCGNLDVLRNDNQNCIEKCNIIEQKCEKIESIYCDIDKLDEMVKAAKESMDTLENEVTKAEEMFTNPNKVVKFFSTFLGKQQKTTNNERPKYEEPNLFSHSNYLK